METCEFREYAYMMLRLISMTTDAQRDTGKPSQSYSDAEISSLLYVAKKHSLSAITVSALESQGAKHQDFREISAKAMRRSILYDREFAVISNALKDKRIHYLPLKGILIKELYPKSWMREMSDIDILFEKDKHEAVKEIMEANGYKTVLYGKNNEDVYKKTPILIFEMHRTLFDPERFPNIQAYFDTIEYQSSDQNEYLLQTGVEDTYIYLVSHVFMHYLASGTGLRSLLDIRLFLTRYENEMDLSYIESQLKKLGADDFEKKIRNLSKSVSEPGDLSDEDKSLLDGFIFSGTYGTKKNYIRNRIARNTDNTAGSKLKYIRKRFSVPADQLREHPFYQKHPKLKPLLATTRFVKAVIKKTDQLLNELKELRDAKQPPR